MSIERRGRPKLEIAEAPRKFTREYIDHEGVRTVWKFDLDKFDKGPIEVECFYPKDYLSPLEKLKRANKKAPKSLQKYFNPANGKMVGYQRAKALGII